MKFKIIIYLIWNKVFLFENINDFIYKFIFFIFNYYIKDIVK